MKYNIFLQSVVLITQLHRKDMKSYSSINPSYQK